MGLREHRKHTGSEHHRRKHRANQDAVQHGFLRRARGLGPLRTYQDSALRQPLVYPTLRRFAPTSVSISHESANADLRSTPLASRTLQRSRVQGAQILDADPGESESVLSSQGSTTSGCFNAMHADFHFDARAEAVEDRHQAINGEATEIGVADAREVRRCNARSGVSRAHGQLVSVQRLDDFGGQDALELVDVRVLMAKVAEDVASSPHQFQRFALHGSILLQPLQAVAITTI